MSYRGMMDGWHGDEHLVDCRRDCGYYCNCSEMDLDEKGEEDYEQWRCENDE